MKKILTAMVLLALFLSVGCEEDEYIAPDSVTDISWYTSVIPGNPYAVNVGEHISFMDASQGTLSHEWTIENGNNYLNSNFTIEEDSLHLYIKENEPLTTNEKTIHVLFNNPGKNMVKLYNTFKDSVSYNGTIPYGAVKKGELWVIDTVMVVDVYDVINPAVDIYQDDVLVASVSENEFPNIENRSTWDTIYVNAGASLKYVDMTAVGRPNERTWSLDGARFTETGRTDSIATVNYYSLGSYTGSIRSSRNNLGGLPLAQTSKLIPVIVKVLKSTEPFVVVEGSFYENATEIISFSVSGELVSFGNEENNFVVHVTNEMTGFDRNIAVSSAKVNSEDATKIDLTLAEPIYNTDVVTVTYVGGNIQSIDERDLEAFPTPQTVTMHLDPNALDSEWAGFEIHHSAFTRAFCEGYWVGPTNGSLAKPFFSRVEGQQSPSGTPVMSYIREGGLTNVVLQCIGFNNMLPDTGTYTYLVSLDVYIETGSNLSELQTNVITPGTELLWDLETIEEGKWVTLTKMVEFASVPTNKINIRLAPDDNLNAGAVVKLYLDNISFISMEERP